MTDRWTNFNDFSEETRRFYLCMFKEYIEDFFRNHKGILFNGLNRYFFKINLKIKNSDGEEVEFEKKYILSLIVNLSFIMKTENYKKIR